MATNTQQPSFKDKAFRLFDVFRRNWGRADVAPNAAELAFYILLSLFPIILVVANIIPLLPIDPSDVLPFLEDALPGRVYEMVAPILENYLNSSGASGAISIGLLTALWSASRAFNSLQRVLNDVYGVEGRDNFIIMRFFSFLIELAIVVVVGLVLFAFVFGEQILLFIESILNIELGFITYFLTLRWLIFGIVLALVFFMVYFLLPNHELGFKYALPGTVFAIIGWLILSQGFSLYVSLAGGEAAASATIGGFIVLMLWLYLAALILLLGALVNTIYFEYQNGKTVEKAREEKEKEEEAKSVVKKSPYPKDSDKKQHKKLTKVKTVEEQKED